MANEFQGLTLLDMERHILWEVGNVIGTTPSYDRFPKWLLRQKMTDAPPPLRVATCDVMAQLYLSQALPAWSGRADSPAELMVSDEGA